MKLHSLKSTNKNPKKRVGRGEGSGLGQQSGRGHKGQKAGSGYSQKRGFEGGQMPLQRRVPKFGFKNPFRVEYQSVNVSKIQEMLDAGVLSEVITHADLVRANFVKSKDLVKILGNGDLKAKITISAHAWSKSAEEKIAAQGGSIQKI